MTAGRHTPANCRADHPATPTAWEHSHFDPVALILVAGVAGLAEVAEEGRIVVTAVSRKTANLNPTDS